MSEQEQSAITHTIDQLAEIVHFALVATIIFLILLLLQPTRAVRELAGLIRGATR